MTDQQNTAIDTNSKGKALLDLFAEFSVDQKKAKEGAPLEIGGTTFYVAKIGSPEYLAERNKLMFEVLEQFKPEHIAALEAGITLKDSGKTTAPYVTCLVRGKPIKLTPEEAVRQLYLRVLSLDLGYPIARMEVEHAVTFGREKAPVSE